MDRVFEQICNLSISASWLILAVLTARFLIRKAPKKYACLLWLLVGIRLVLPFSIESSFSLVPAVKVSDFSETVNLKNNINVESEELMFAEKEHQENVGVQIYEPVENFRADSQETSKMDVIMYLWLCGLGIMICYFLGSSLYLKKKLSTAVRYRENIRQNEYVNSPFVFGMIFPKIYIPYHMPEESLEYVIAHENVHIKRKDHWTKAIAFLILSVYWFHPLVWLSYAFLCKDIEMACDEQVVLMMDEDERKFYSLALLACHGKRTWYHACPVGFGEVNVKERVTHVMNYRKPSFWLVLISIVLGIVVAVCFFTSAKTAENEEINPTIEVVDFHLGSWGIYQKEHENHSAENTLSVEDILVENHSVWKDYVFQWLSWNELSQLIPEDYSEWISAEGANGRMVYRTVEGITYLLPEYADGVHQIAGILLTDKGYQLDCGLSVGMRADKIEELQIPLDIYVKDESYGGLKQQEGIGEISLYDGLNDGQMIEFDYVYSNSNGFVMDKNEQKERLQELGLPEGRLSEVHLILSAFVKDEKVSGIFIGIVP